MSNYLNCCKRVIRRNDTNLLSLWPTWYPACDISAWRSGDTTSPIYPFARGDYSCDAVPFSSSVNACHLGPWPLRGTFQTFEVLGLMFGVTFTYSGTTITAHKTAHGLVLGGEAFKIYGQLGVNAVLNGSWTVATIPDANSFTFTIDAAPSGALNPATLDFRDIVDECLQAAKGWKGVQAGKEWLGRNDFKTDYVAHPELATTRWRAYDVSVAYSETATDTYPEGDTTVTSTGGWDGNSSRSLSVGGVEDCRGGRSSGLGTTTDINNGGHNVLFLQSLVEPVPDAIAYQNGVIAEFCAVNGDRGVVTCVVPYGYYQTYWDFSDPCYGAINANGDNNTTFAFQRHTFRGRPEDFAAFLTRSDATIDLYCPDNGKHHTLSIRHTGSISISKTQIIVHVEIHCLVDAPQGVDIGSGVAIFDATATLSDPYTLAQADLDAKGLLAYWDMSNDVIMPWRADDSCTICPYVTRWEKNNAPGVGYCDTPANADELAIYDGSVRGAPINYYADSGGNPYAVGYYDKGWFDWGAQRYTYTENGDGTATLCYQFGFYVNVPSVTMATQSTPGTTDNPPFNRYINPHANYNLPFPPWMNYSGGYAATDGSTVYVAKWAEQKMPLASQNYWGACGAMRDLKILDATTCDPGANRYSAWPICGRVAIVSITRDAGTGVVTVVHEAAPYLRTGDTVDFINADNSAATGTNIAVTVTDGTTFHYTGTLPAGAYLKSHGAPDPSWYDLAPKGYFVRAVKNKGAHSAEEGNVTPHNGHRAIIAILPPNSPELNVWPADSTVTYTDYGQATIPPVGTSWDDAGWYSAITQAMDDRFWIKKDDGMIGGVDPDTGLNVCYVLNKDGSACDDPIYFPCDPATAPLVEARLHAPMGAPLQFTSDSADQWLKMPVATDFGFRCSGAWNLTPVTGGFRTQFGVSTNTADAFNTSGISSASDAGWGTADATFTP